MNKWVNALCLLLLSILLTGCWDRVEIEERGFTVGVAIDIGEDGKVEEQKTSHVYKGTYQLVIPGGLSQGSGTSSGNLPAFQNLSLSNDSLFQQIRYLAQRTSRSLFFEHLKMIIISEEVAKTPGAFANIMDIFRRDHEMRRGVKILIAKGEASDILQYNTKTEPLPVMFIESIVGNAPKNPLMLQEVRIGTVHKFLVSKDSFIVPKIEIKDGKIDVEGAAVIKGRDNTMADFISGPVTEGLNFIKGDYKSGIVKATVDDFMVVYEIKYAKSKIKVNTDDPNHITFDILIETEGVIGESFGNFNFTDKEVLRKAEQAFREEIKKSAERTVKTLQDDLKIDALGLGDYVRRKDYDLWRKKLIDNWDSGENYFVKSDINIKVKTIIRGTGGIIQNERD